MPSTPEWEIGFALWVRLAAFMAAAPAWGMPQVPLRSRLAIALVLAIPLTPTAGAAIDRTDWVWMVVGEGVAGFAMGFALRGLLLAAEMVGDWGAAQLGLDDRTSGETGALAGLMGALAGGVFLLLNGPQYWVVGMARTLQLMPVGSWNAGADWGAVAASLASAVTTLALTWAGPWIVALLIAQVGLHAAARLSPTWRASGAAVALTPALGWLFLAATLGGLGWAWEEGPGRALEDMGRVLVGTIRAR